MAVTFFPKNFSKLRQASFLHDEIQDNKKEINQQSFS